MKILVTGASGFVGLALVEALARRGDDVCAVDLREPATLRNLSADSAGSVTVRAAEITEWAQLADCFAAYRPDSVVHCAAIVGVVNSLASPVTTMRVNVEGSLNVFNLARLYGARRVVHLSSEEVYGPFDADRIDESHPCRPLQPYGISKYAVERLARDFVESSALDIIHLRLSWAYGPRLPRPRVPKTLIDAALAGRPLHMESGGDFRADHTHVDDAVAALLCALDVGDHAHDVYNIGSGTAPSLAEIVTIIREIVPGDRAPSGGRPQYRRLPLCFARSPQVAQPVGAGLQRRHPEGERLRRSLAAVADVEQRKTNEMIGAELGYRYVDSPLIWDEPGGPEQRFRTYDPTVWTGVRLPHVWLGQGKSIYDVIGRTFAILMGDHVEKVEPPVEAFMEIGAPITVLEFPDDRLRQLYGRSYFHVRPDLHIAWRGNELPDDPRKLAAVATGYPVEGMARYHLA